MNEMDSKQEFQDVTGNFLNLRKFMNRIDKQNLTSKNHKKSLVTPKNMK